MTGSVGYGRQSHGKQKSIDEQLGCYIARVSEEGWENRGLFTDKISASPFAAKKVRGGWAKLLKFLADPGVSELWLWESSRGDRQASSWLQMLEICQENNVKIFVETHERPYDMSISRDWKTLADEGTDSEYASRKSSVQIKRAVAAQIRDGRPPGRIPYGYRRIYKLIDGKRKFVRQEADPAEAPAVREIFRRLHADDPANGIARDLNEHGPALRTGKPWTLNRVVTIAKTAAYAGLRVHTSERDMAARRSLGPGVEVHELVNVERLVTRETFYAVQARLADPARKTTRPGGARHLLSYVAKCGTCGGPLTAHGGAIRKPTYYCPAAGHVTVPKDVLDVTVTVEAVSYLIETELGREQESGEATAELQAIRDELAGLRHRREGIGAALATGDLSVQTAVSAEQAIDMKISALQKRDRELSVPAKLHDLLDDPDWLVAERWVRMPLPARKEAMRLLLSEEHLGVLYVMPAPPQGRGRGARTYPLWKRLEWRKDAADGTLLGRRRVSKTEWSPWYVVGADTARATESGTVIVVPEGTASPELVSPLASGLST